MAGEATDDGDNEQSAALISDQSSVVNDNLSRLSESLWSLRCLFEYNSEEHRSYEGIETPEHDEEFETFLSNNSDLRDNILMMLDEFEAMESLCVSPDPDIEGMFVGLVDELVNTSFQMTDMIGRGWRSRGFSARSIDHVGGPGTMATVWELLKELRGVVGVKRKLSEADWEESTDSSDNADDDTEQAEEMVPDLASSAGSSSDAVDSIIDEEDNDTSNPAVSDASDISLVRRSLVAMAVVDEENGRPLRQGDHVPDGDIQRQLVPMVMRGEVRAYLDDVVLVPGPSIMNEEEQDQHEREEEEFVAWIERRQSDEGGRDEENDSDESGVSLTWSREE